MIGAIVGNRPNVQTPDVLPVIRLGPRARFCGLRPYKRQYQGMSDGARTLCARRFRRDCATTERACASVAPPAISDRTAIRVCSLKVFGLPLRASSRKRVRCFEVMAA